MIKLLVVGMVLYVAYMAGVDKGIPEQRRLAALERRVMVLETQVKAQRGLTAPPAAASAH